MEPVHPFKLEGEKSLDLSLPQSSYVKQALQEIMSISQNDVNFVISDALKVIKYKNIEIDLNLKVKDNALAIYQDSGDTYSTELLTLFTENRVNYLREVASNLSNDFEELSKKFDIQNQVRKISIRSTDGDFHNKSKNPLLIEIESIEGSKDIVKLVYKPRSLKMDALLYDTVLSKTDAKYFPKRNVLDKRNYGYDTFVEGEELHSGSNPKYGGTFLDEDNKSFFSKRNVDCLKKDFYVFKTLETLNITDVHAGNFKLDINKNLILIDAECFNVIGAYSPNSVLRAHFRSFSNEIPNDLEVENLQKEVKKNIVNTQTRILFLTTSDYEGFYAVFNQRGSFTSRQIEFHDKKLKLFFQENFKEKEIKNWDNIKEFVWRNIKASFLVRDIPVFSLLQIDGCVKIMSNDEPIEVLFGG